MSLLKVIANELNTLSTESQKKKIVTIKDAADRVLGLIKDVQTKLKTDDVMEQSKCFFVEIFFTVVFGIDFLQQ